jgi:phage recombination protein Bet
MPVTKDSPQPAAEPQATQTQVVETGRHQGLVAKFAARFGVEPSKMLTTLKATAFKVKDGEATNEQLMALLIVADQYGLNPWTREIYAFPDSQRGIVPIVGIDGWCRLINEHPQFDGVEFRDGPLQGAVPEWIECTIHRKDRTHPTTTREYFAECKRNTGPWGSHPRRMLRHKALIQCGRIAFSFVGIFDEDEGERIVEATHVTSGPERQRTVAIPQARGSAPATPPADPHAAEQDGEREPGGDDVGQQAEQPQPGPKVDLDKKIGKGVLQTLRNHLAKKQIPESEFCHAWTIEKLEDLPQVKAGEAGSWITNYKS